MAKINIPNNYLPGLRALSLLSEKEVNNLYDALRKMPRGISVMKFKDSLSNIGIDGSDQLAGAIFSFGQLLKDPAFEQDKFIEDITTKYKSIQESDKLLDFNEGIFKERLRFILLSCNSIRTTSELVELVYAGSNTLIDTSIISETRIISPEQVGANPDGVLVHRLVVNFQKGRKREASRAVFMLDSDDLFKLKIRIDDALEKKQILEQLNNINYINLI